MYAFGDDIDPLPESANVLEEILVDYLSEMVSVYTSLSLSVAVEPHTPC